MSKFALRRCVVLTAAIVSLALPAFAQEAFAQDAFDLSVPEEGVEAGPPPNMECAAESLSGSGPGFTSSRDRAEEAALSSWLEKAKAVYPEATWEMARDANLSCAVQGLYSKCFADGIPCRPKSGDGSESAADAPQAE